MFSNSADRSGRREQIAVGLSLIVAYVTTGSCGLINATGRTHGPSWRMVVSLGPEIEAWGIYPGGQSGNPGSARYDEFIDEWVEGELAELLFLKSKTEVDPRIVSRLAMRQK